MHSSIALAGEIKYLSTYVQLEQMRSEPPFEYQVAIDPALTPTEVSIPVMVLQPFVENAIRHGMNGIEGLITISFSANDQELICRVEDNGIGRQQATRQKTIAPAVYQSRGMQLTYERIELINTHADKKITVEIIDKFDDDNEPGGTDVIIRFPHLLVNTPHL
jgi:LytS/YehU family sensor histidine kinase